MSQLQMHGEMIAMWSLIALPMSVLMLGHLCFQQLLVWLMRKLRNRNK